jgi:hypothetical protein
MRTPFFSMFVAALCAATLLAARPGPAVGQESVIAMSGVIHPGADSIFRAAVSRSRPDLVILSGPGGDLGTALHIAAEVRRRGIDTAIPQGAYCASACAVIFLSGRTKYISPGGMLGLHAASNLDGSFSREGTAIMAQYLAQIGVPSRVISRMQARQGNDMYWLADADRRALKIVALSSGRAPAASRARAAAARAPARVAQRSSRAVGCPGGACYQTLPNGVIMKVR